MVRVLPILPRWLLAGLLAGALLLPGTLAGGQERALEVALGSEPATLDPFLATDANGVRISHQLIFETLVRLGGDLEIVPGLATWDRISPTRYRFTLRAGARFHDGFPLQTVDALATLRRFMAPETGSPYGAALREQIAGLRALDERRFEITLQGPFASFLADLALPVAPQSAPGGAAAGAGDEAARLNGSGPFRFERRGPGEIVLARNPYHPQPAGVARVIFKVVADENTRLLKFVKGDLQLGVNVLPLDKLERFGQPPLADRYRVLEGPGLSFQYLGFNMEDGLLARPKVRQAIAHAIDVDALIEHRQKGHSVRATGLFPPGSPYDDPALQPFAYDPALAERLLDEAGYPLAGNRRFTLTYKTTTDRSAIVQARVIQSDLRKVGIEVEVRSYEWATFYEDIKRGNFQVYSLRWIGVSDPGFLYELLHSGKLPPEGRNRGRFRDPALDALLERARLEPDAERRRALYREAHRAVFAALPYLPLWHNNNVAVVSRALEGFSLHPSGGFEHLAEARWKAP